MARVSRGALVVDDNCDAAQSVAESARAAGHEVVVAFDGIAAVSSAARFQRDLVLLDIGPLGMNGGVFHFRPFLGNTAERGQPARAGEMFIRELELEGGVGAPPARQPRCGRGSPKPSNVKQCGCFFPVINSRGLLPVRPTRLRMKRR